MESSTSKRKKSLTRGSKIIIVLLVVSVMLGGTILAIKLNESYRVKRYDAIVNGNTFHSGITVSGVDVSGMTINEAKIALADVESGLVSDLRFSLKYNDETTEVGAGSFSVLYNTDEVLAEAMSLAREGELDELDAEIDDIRANGRSYTITYTLDEQSVMDYVAVFSDHIDTDPTPASFTVHQLEINTTTNAPDARNIGLSADATDTDLRDLRFDFVEAVDGYGVNREELVALIMERCDARDFGEIEVPLAPIESDVTIETIKAELVLRASASTSFAKGHYGRASRVHNMTKATGLMYGYVLMPGERFSCNTILGDRTEKLGWQLAPAVIEGGAATEDQAGGGVCQVSTTLYNAVLMSDLEIVSRRAHSQKLSYVAGGLDATINTGTIDFIWTNNLDTPVYIFTWIDTEKKTINCEIYGEPFPETFDSIELESELFETIDPDVPTYTVDATLSYPYWRMINDAIKGYTYKTYAIYKLGDTTVEKRLIAETTYNAHPARYLVWEGWTGDYLLPEYQLEYVRE